MAFTTVLKGMSLKTQYIIKRIFDVLVSFALLVCLLPLFVLLALVIKLDSPGPILYKATRVGKKQAPFKMWKFRTMQANADRVGPGLTEHDDPRITSVGKLLRRLSLDELPQLFNVLFGQMSLVGPRPEITEIVKNYSAGQLKALSVYPGITGLSQINGRDDLPVDKKVGFDLEYIEKFSLVQDFIIIVKTIPALLNGRGNRF